MRKVWTWGWLCCLFSFAGAQADPREQIVSFREPAQRVQQILEALSANTQLKLVASHAVKDEIVLIDAERLTLQQLMDGLALALDAEWQAQPDGSYRLHRTVSQAQRRRAIENQTLTRRWREYAASYAPQNLQNTLSEADARAALQRIRKTLHEAQNHPDKDIYDVATPENFYQPLSDINLAERLLERLLRQMDWNEFAQIPVGEQRAYGTHPSAFVQPFKKSPAPLIQQFMQELATLQRSGSEYDVRALQRLLKEVAYFPEDYFPDFTPLQQHGVSNLYLVVRRVSPCQLDITLSLRSETPQGQPYILAETRYYRAEVENLNQPESSEWRSKPILWSELSRQMLPLLGRRSAPPTAEQLQSLSPARVEPLSLVATDILRAYAAARQQPLIALLPDHATNPRRVDIMHNLNENTRVGEAERYLAQWEWIEGAILIAKPHTASYHWNRRCQRDGVERIVQQARQRGCVDWNDYLALAQIAPDEDSAGACFWWLRANGVDIYYVPELIASLQVLPPPLWNRLLQGETIPLAELPPPVITRLHHTLYTLDAGTVYAENSVSSDLLDVAAYYPNGLPREMRLRLQQETRLGVFTENRFGVWFKFLEYADAEDTLNIDLDAIEHPGTRSDYARLQQNLRSNMLQYGREYFAYLEILPPDSEEGTIGLILPYRYELVGKPARWNEPPDELKAELEARRTHSEKE